MATNDAILTELSHLARTGREVKVLNFYRGYPLTSRANILKVADNQVRLHVHPPASICLEWKQRTWLLTDEPLEAIQAGIQSFNIETGELTLDDWGYVDDNFGRRMVVRVEPTAPLIVEIKKGNATRTGQLADISVGGAGILLLNPEESSEYQVGETLQITLHLPTGKILLTDKVQSISNLDGAIRLSVRFNRPVAQKESILRYIADRRAEILKEVEELYNLRLTERRKLTPPSSTLLPNHS